MQLTAAQLQVKYELCTCFLHWGIVSKKDSWPLLLLDVHRKTVEKKKKTATALQTIVSLAVFNSKLDSQKA